MVQIVPYDPARKSEISQLMERTLGLRAGRPRDEAYWTWKHELNPFGPSLVLLAEEHGRLVGMRAFMRWELETGTTRLAAGKPVDSVTDPQFQRRGIFSQLTQAACEQARAEGIRLLFNTPNRNSLPGYLKLGWQQVGRLRVRLDLLRPLSMAWRVVSRRAVFDDNWPASCFTSAPQRAADVLDDAEEINALINAATRPARALATRRDQAFLKWRYSLHPHEQYYAETVRTGDRLQGILLFRLGRRRGFTEVMIDDAIVRRDSQGCLASLLESLKARTRADYFASHAPGTADWRAARRSSGLTWQWTKAVDFVARSLDDIDDLNPARLDSWRLCLGDLEGL